MFDEGFVWALGDKNRASGLKIWINEGKKEFIEYFKERFDTRWNEALEYMQAHYDSCVEKDENYYPLSYEERDDCVYIGIGDLILHYDYGDYYDTDQGSDALDHALNDAAEHYPGLKYDGHIVYIASDVIGGVAGDYFISSEKEKNNERSRAIAGEFIRDLYEALDHYLLDITGHKVEKTKVIENLLDNVRNKYGVDPYAVWYEYEDRMYDYDYFAEAIKFHKKMEGWIGEDILEHVYEALIVQAREVERKYKDEGLEEKVAYAVQQVKSGNRRLHERIDIIDC